MTKTPGILFAAGVVATLLLGCGISLFLLNQAREMELRLAAEARQAEVRAQERSTAPVSVSGGELELPQGGALERENSRLRARVAELEDELEALRARLETGAPGVGAGVAPKELEAPLAWLQELSPTRFRDMTADELAHLRDLDLTGLEITDEDLAALRHLPSLRDLQLQKTGVTDDGLPYLQDIPSLRHLGLRETQVTDDGMAHLQGMTDLTRLDVNLTAVGDRGLSYLAGLTNLEFLRLNYTQISDRALAELRGLDHLRQLDLWGTKITDAALDHLWNLPALERLELGATNLSEAAVRRFMDAHPSCYVHSRWTR